MCPAPSVSVCGEPLSVSAAFCPIGHVESAVGPFGCSAYLFPANVQDSLMFHLCLFLSSSTTEKTRADNTSAIWNFLSDIFLIRSSYITRPSVVIESGVKMVMN